MDSRSDTLADLLTNHPDLDEQLHELLELDSKHETWTFDDTELDSGQFGELVSRGIVDKSNGEYHLANPASVRQSLGIETHHSKTPDISQFNLSIPTPSIDLRASLGLTAVLIFLFAMRIHQYPALARDHHLLSPANDPYFYRYWIDEFLAESTDWTSTELLSNLPSGAAGRRPFTHAANWWIAAFLGGDQWASTMTAIWLPVIATLLLGIVVYFIAKLVTDDVRVGMASVFFLALVPVHAVYSGVGFLEHRLHQYFWLGVTLLALTYLAVDFQRHLSTNGPRHAVKNHLRNPRTWLAALTLAPALAFSIHAWGGSIMMCIPLAAYAGGRAIIDARANVSPLLANIPLMVGTAGATGLSAFLHLRWGWHEGFVVYIPLLVLAGMIAVFLVGELFRYTDWPPAAFAGLQIIIAGGGLWIFRTRYPEYWERLMDRSEDLIDRGSTATETMSLFEDLLTPILQIGLDVVLAFAVLAWAWYIIWHRYEPAWLALSTYSSVWLLFAWYQIRFAAQLSIILSIFGGFALVYILAKVDLARPPKPFQQSKTTRRPGKSKPDEPSIKLPSEPAAYGYMALILLLFAGVSLLFVPLLAGDTTYDDDQYDSLLAIEEHNESIADYDHDPFVLSNWGDNRMYNYFVHGDSRSYGYASSNYQPFIESDHPDDHYDEIASQVGYVVIDDLETTDLPNNTYTTLHGDINDTTLPDSGHFQALHLGDTASAYATVPGATITVNGTNESITTTTAITLDDTDYSYERTLTEASNTTTATTVAYPGDYDLLDQTVSITQEDVINGSTIELDY